MNASYSFTNAIQLISAKHTIRNDTSFNLNVCIAVMIHTIHNLYFVVMVIIKFEGIYKYISLPV